MTKLNEEKNLNTNDVIEQYIKSPDGYREEGRLEGIALVCMFLNAQDPFEDTNHYSVVKLIESSRLFDAVTPVKDDLVLKDGLPFYQCIDQNKLRDILTKKGYLKQSISNL